MSGDKLNHRVTNLEKAIHKIEKSIAVSPPRQKHEAGQSPQQAAGKENNAAGGQVPPSPHPCPSPSNTQQANNPWYRSWEGWKIRLEVVGIPFAILYAVVTALQWRDLHTNFKIDERAWMEARRSLPEQSVDELVFIGTPAEIYNIGKTPAVKIVIQTRAEIIALDIAPSLSYDNAETTVAGAIFQSGSFKFFVGEHTKITGL